MNTRSPMSRITPGGLLQGLSLVGLIVHPVLALLTEAPGYSAALWLGSFYVGAFLSPTAKSITVAKVLTAVTVALAGCSSRMG